MDLEGNGDIAEIAKIDEKIARYEEDRKIKEGQLRTLINNSSKSNEGQIELIRKETETKIKPINEQIQSIAKKLEKLDERKVKQADAEANKDQEIEDLEDERDELIRKIDEDHAHGVWLHDPETCAAHMVCGPKILQCAQHTW